MKTRAKAILITIIALSLTLVTAAGVAFAWLFKETALPGTGIGIQSGLPDFSFKVAQYENGEFVDKWTQDGGGAYESLLTTGGFSYFGGNTSSYYKFTLMNAKKSAVYGSIFYYLDKKIVTALTGYEDVIRGDILMFGVSDGNDESGEAADVPKDMLWSAQHPFSVEASAENPNYIAGQAVVTEGSVTVAAQFFVNPNVVIPAESQAVFYLKVDYNESVMWELLKGYVSADTVRAVCPLVFRGYATSSAVTAPEVTP